MESKLSLINRAMGAAIRAEIAAQDRDKKEVGISSGIGAGQFARLISTNDDLLRDINITQISEIAHALNTTAEALVEDAIKRAGGLEAVWADRQEQRERERVEKEAMSEASTNNVTKLSTRRRQQEDRKVADAFDPEADQPDD